ncbi:MAG: DUF5320 domain-containing protein [Chloroflexi bacterium]|nr:DUF5320 domain-containing protein [Chloroflexota bacterium]
MPARDGTGPFGNGPFGRGMGPCRGGYAGWGQGRGFMRGVGVRSLPTFPEDEKNWLESQKSWLESQLQSIKERLHEGNDR